MIWRRILSFVTVLLALSAQLLSAQDISEQQSRKAAIEKEIAQLEKQIAENTSKNSSALNDLVLVRRQVEARKALVAESESELGRINDTIRTITAETARLQARIDTLSLYFNRLIRGAYRNRDSRIWYVYIFGSKDPAQAARRYSYLRNLSSTMNGEASEHKDMKETLGRELDRLDSLQTEATAMRDRYARELEKLQEEEKRANSLVVTLNRYKTRYQQQLTNRRRQVEALNREIEQIIARHVAESEKDAAGSSEDAKRAAAADYKLAAEFEKNMGKLPWPADGPVLEKFGEHYHPVYTRIKMPSNNGINIGLAKGSAVSAVFEGEVKNIMVEPGYNKCVLIQHGSYFTLYCKLDQVGVRPGDKVRPGDVIGIVDTIDGRTELHFQVWKGNDAQDPEIWLRPR